MKYYTIGEFAELIGKNAQTLREWDKKTCVKHTIYLQLATDTILRNS